MYRDAAPDHEVVIVGTGFSGVGMGANLKRSGNDDFVILEKAESIGGTWRENHYPGCACDVQSHLYSFSFAKNPGWSRMFAPQDEIRTYLERTAFEGGLGPHIRFGAAFTGAEWDPAHGLWEITVNGSETITARALVSGAGGLHIPSIPELPGIGSFEGESWHSAEWNHDYDLEGKRVAVIGTGASAIQFVPQIAGKVASLDLYQRTAPWVIPKPDREVGARERRLYRRFPLLQGLYRQLLWLQYELRGVAFTVEPRILRIGEKLAAKHIHDQISDPELRRKVTPDYRMGCKRVLISDDYYPALDRDNVDVLTGGIAEVRADSIVGDDGVERPVDAIIYGTGFRIHDMGRALNVTGRDGVELGELWEREGMTAHRGTTVAGFPNLFILQGPNVGLAHSSMIYMIESQITYVMAALRTMRDRGLRAMEPRSEAQAAYNEWLQDQLGDSIWSNGGCRSWYLDDSGRNTTLWPTFTFRFRQQTATFKPEEYVLEPHPAPAPEQPAPAAT